MPDNDPYLNAPDLQPRLGVPAGSHEPPIGPIEHVAAIELEQHIADGDLGSVRSLAHEMEYGLSPFKVNPWRLIECLAGRAVSRQQEAAGETAPDVLPAPAAASQPAAAG